MQNAEECAWRATVEADSDLARTFLEMERHWRKLARHYQLAEQLHNLSKEQQHNGHVLDRGPSTAPDQTP
jgi:hypothetical protein